VQKVKLLTPGKLILTLLIFFVFILNSYSQYQIVDAFPNLPALINPVDLQNAGDCTNRLFVIEQVGRIRVFENRPDVNSFKTFLDITDRVSSGGEMGLLGLAFHPDYESNGYFFVNYTAANPRRSVISRFSVSLVNPDSADKNSELILFEQSQPFSNHNGGQVAFGSDGYLYIALGDGGSGGDPDNYAQTLHTLLGKISRIDVDNQDPGLNYAIPPDNPFVDSTGTVRKEIYAWGLRNPWRFSFDPVTDWLWCGDVGQSAREEIDIVENGENYGWRCYEGNLPYNTTGCLGPENYVFPVYDYPRTDGGSITGGYVYRGPNQPALYRKYIYADYVSRRVWSLEYDGINPPTVQQLFQFPSGTSPTSFGVDEAGELYICTFTTGNGRVRKFVPTAPVTAPSFLTLEVTAPLVIELNWYDNSNNETGFRIERSDEGGSFSEIATVGANVTFYQDVVTQAIDYTYRVNAFNSTDTSGYSNEACISGDVVPVELALFTVEISRNENAVILKWETASEINNRGFEIERSLPSLFGDFEENFNTIGFVEGNGTTTEKSYYSFKDDFGIHAFSGTVKYRLKQIDYDGTFAYSPTVAVDLNLTQQGYYLEQNYPNPFNPSTAFRFNIPEESRVKIDVINILGEIIDNLVNGTRQSGSYSEVWNADKFTSGIYYVRMNAESLVSDKSFTQTIKIVYLK
jgi:glucose/arabinose dehydrogenase